MTPAIQAGVLVGVLVAAALIGTWFGRRLERGQHHAGLNRLIAGVDRVRVEHLERLPEQREDTETLVGVLRRSIDALLGELDRQRQLGGAFAELQEGFVVLDPQGRVQFANPAARSVLGNGLTSGSRLQEVARQLQVLDTVRAVGPESGWVTGEIYESLDGRLIQPQAGPLGDGRAALLVRDVTLEQRAETMRREFVANVSHELKTPLTAIRGYAETLREDLADPTQERFVGRILDHCRRLEELLADVMDLAKLESDEGVGQVVRAPVDLCRLLTDEIERARESHPESTTKVSLEGPAQLEYHGHREFLAQLFGNLLDNALKYSPDGSRVEVAVVVDTDEILVAVEDNGPGISTEHLPHLFERFYRVGSDRARASGGTGLGLAIVKHAARVHGGSVSVHSRLGHGSRFEVRLPTDGR